MRCCEKTRALINLTSAFSVEYNPQTPHLLAVCGSTGLTIYDLRNVKNCYANAGLVSKFARYSAWNPEGNGIFCLITNGNPIYYNVELFEFKTLKSFS